MPLLEIALILVIVALAAWLINAYVPMPANVRQILNVVAGLIVIGMLLWLINTYVPMAGVIKAILNIVVVVAAVVWVLKAFGLWGSVVEQSRELRSRISHG